MGGAIVQCSPPLHGSAADLSRLLILLGGIVGGAVATVVFKMSKSSKGPLLLTFSVLTPTEVTKCNRKMLSPRAGGDATINGKKKLPPSTVLCPRRHRIRNRRLMPFPPSFCGDWRIKEEIFSASLKKEGLTFRSRMRRRRRRRLRRPLGHKERGKFSPPRHPLFLPPLPTCTGSIQRLSRALWSLVVS